jgi:hypothetical protein
VQNRLKLLRSHSGTDDLQMSTLSAFVDTVIETVESEQYALANSFTGIRP